ncbi:MAG: S-methyl-5'-thioadenosine phosphorylase [Dehalococcoidia bacterium]
MSEAKIGVIGGSGFYQLEGLTDIEEIRPDTPYGATSDAIVLGTLSGTRIAFVPRHGLGHRILPTEVPSHANIWALKDLGVERIIAISAVGSLREEMAPYHFVVPDQLLDRTFSRTHTFFGEGLVGHISFDEPFCPVMRDVLVDAAKANDVTCHRGGTLVVVEGPAFSTKAEAALYRSWNADIIGMTALPEAKLAREAEMCYGGLTLVTDYDVWHETEAPVSADIIIKNMLENIGKGKLVTAAALANLPAERSCACGLALEKALITARDRIPLETKRKLAPIIGKYVQIEVGS